eukprot:g5639.t1
MYFEFFVLLRPRHFHRHDKVLDLRSSLATQPHTITPDFVRDHIVKDRKLTNDQDGLLMSILQPCSSSSLLLICTVYALDWALQSQQPVQQDWWRDQGSISQVVNCSVAPQTTMVMVSHYGRTNNMLIAIVNLLALAAATPQTAASIPSAAYYSKLLDMIDLRRACEGWLCLVDEEPGLGRKIYSKISYFLSGLIQRSDNHNKILPSVYVLSAYQLFFSRDKHPATRSERARILAHLLSFPTPALRGLVESLPLPAKYVGVHLRWLENECLRWMEIILNATAAQSDSAFLNASAQDVCTMSRGYVAAAIAQAGLRGATVFIGHLHKIRRDHFPGARRTTAKHCATVTPRLQDCNIQWTQRPVG